MRHLPAISSTIPLRLVYLLLIAVIMTAGCASGDVTENPPTLTAQAERAMQLATRMAGTLQPTWQAANAWMTATAESYLGQVEIARNWPIVMADSFDDDSGAWSTGVMTDTLGDIDWQIAGSKFTWNLKAKDGVVWWNVPDMEALTDFYVAADVRQVNGPIDAQCGIIFRRASEEDYYLLEIDNSGQYGLFKHSGSEWNTLSDWSKSPALLLSQSNHLVIIGQGDMFVLLINDQLVLPPTTLDTDLTSGTFGLAVGLSYAGQEASWEFDNFELRAPSISTTPP